MDHSHTPTERQVIADEREAEQTFQAEQATAAHTQAVTSHIDVLEALCRRYAARVGQNGVVYLTHDGDPLLARAFKKLGWADRHPETGFTKVEAAAVESSEKAVLPKATRRIV